MSENGNGNGHGPAPAAGGGKRLIEILASRDREITTEAATSATPKADAPIVAKRQRVGGRKRAEIAQRAPEVIQGPRSPRSPQLSAGVTLTRTYKGKRVVVHVLGEHAFEFEGARFKSLSAIANHVTGGHHSGVRWFGLIKVKKAAKKS